MELIKDKQTKNKYPAYKYSGVEWLEDVPAHWELKKVKRIFVEKKYSTNVDLNCGSISFGKVVLKDDEKIPLATKKSYQVLSKGEFLVNPLNLNYDLISLRIALSELEVVVSSGYIILKNVIEINKTYFKWLLHRFDVAYMKLLGSGVRQTLNYNDIGECNLVFPPLDEQKSIANFLEHKTSLIDKAIAIKDKQIELLKERRQILIHKAVTHGLNPNVKMKNSGVEWIGDVPEYWEILPGLRFFKENKRNNIGMKENVVLSLSYGKVIIKPIEKLIGLVPESFETYQIVMPNDIIIRGTDLQNDKTSLRTGLAKNKGIITSAYINLNVINNNRADFLHYYLHALDITKILYKFGTGLRQNLSFVDIKRLPIVSIPIIEQEEIVNFIKKMENIIESAISFKGKEIEKLKEYKATLINSVVTGKIKVS